MTGSAAARAYNVVNAMGLEALALVNTRAFQVRMATLGANNVGVQLPRRRHSLAGATGQDELYRMIPDLSAHIG